MPTEPGTPLPCGKCGLVIEDRPVRAPLEDSGIGYIPFEVESNECHTTIRCLQAQLAEREAEIERLRAENKKLDEQGDVFLRYACRLEAQAKELMKRLDDKGKAHADRIATKILGMDAAPKENSDRKLTAYGNSSVM